MLLTYCPFLRKTVVFVEPAANLYERSLVPPLETSPASMTLSTPYGGRERPILFSFCQIGVVVFYPLFQSKGQDNYIRSTSPTLVHSWATNSSCTFNEGAVTYFRNKILNLKYCMIDVLVRPDFTLYDPLIDFLQVAINASFNVRRTILMRPDSTKKITRLLVVIEVSFF